MNELSSKTLNSIIHEKDSSHSQILNHIKTEHLAWLYSKRNEDGSLESVSEAAYLFSPLFKDNYFLFFSKWGVYGDLISEEDWRADFDFLSEKPYEGIYPRIYEFIDRITFNGVEQKSNINQIFTEEMEKYNPETEGKPAEQFAEEISNELCRNINVFLDFFDTISSINAWAVNKKIYRISDMLTEDFVEQDVIFPTDALNNLPFKSFAIDLSKNKLFGGIFDCCIVRVIEHKNNYVVDYKLFDKDGIQLLCGEETILRFPADMDNTAESVDYFTGWRRFHKKNLQSYNINIHMLSALAYADAVSGITKKNYNLSKQAGKVVGNTMYTLLERDEECPNPGNKLEEDIRYAVAKISKQAIDFEQRIGIRSIIDNKYMLFNDAPARYYKKFVKFLFCTLFYLCCTNRTTKKTVTGASDTPVKQRRKSKEAPEKKETGEIAYEVLQTAQEKLASEEQVSPKELQSNVFINYNELNIDKGEYVPSQTLHREGKKLSGKTKKPHLVRGHFHHYRCGKGKKEVIYKYVEPYYTGIRRDIVSVTDIK